MDEERPIVTMHHHPDDPGVIDQFLDGIYGLEVFEEHATGYALEVVRHYFGNFSDEWYFEWITTEEFRGGVFPGGARMTRDQLRRYEKMYEMYWHARCEWFNLMISNLNRQNLAEQNRIMYMGTMVSDQSWEEFGKAARLPENRITHHLKDDES